MVANPAAVGVVSGHLASTVAALEGGSRETTDLRVYVKRHVTSLAEALQADNKLPAVLFYLNRAGCESTALELYEHLRRTELINQNSPEAARLKGMEEQLRTANDAYQRQRASAGPNPPPSVVQMLDDKRANVSSLQTQVDTQRERLFRRNAYIAHDVSLPTEEEVSKLMRGEANWANPLHRALLYGVGVHHAGLHKRYRQAVVDLFRGRKLGVILATATLAQGIHMPCRTVAFIGSSPYLNAVTFRQMSGRAGRRNFELRGDVVLFGFTPDEVAKILSAELPRLRPNRPLRASLALRILMQLYLMRERARAHLEAKRPVNARELTATAEACVDSARRLLRDGIDSVARGGGSSSSTDVSAAELEDRVAHQNGVTFRFLVDTFRHLGIVDAAGRPSQTSTLIAHLHFLEPANLAFVNLLRSGVLEQLTDPIPIHLRRRKTELQDQCDRLFAVFSYLLRPLPISARVQAAFYSMPEATRPFRTLGLPPLPEGVLATLAQWNQRQVDVAVAYYADYCARHLHELGGPDRRLPFTGIAVGAGGGDGGAAAVGESAWLRARTSVGRVVRLRSAFLGLCNHGDDDIASLAELARSRRTGLWLDTECIPAMDLPLPSHISGDVYQFFRRGAPREIEKVFRLQSNEVYEATFDLSLALQSVWAALKRILMDTEAEDAAAAADLEDAVEGDVGRGAAAPAAADRLPFSRQFVDLVEAAAITMLRRLHQLRSRTD